MIQIYTAKPSFMIILLRWTRDFEDQDQESAGWKVPSMIGTEQQFQSTASQLVDNNYNCTRLQETGGNGASWWQQQWPKPTL